jgi:hypothetical protein
MSDAMWTRPADDAERDTIWRAIETAPRMVPVLVKLKADLPSDHAKRFQNVTFVGFRSDHDLTGWVFAAPVGCGGFPDDWMVGWAPLPESELRQSRADDLETKLTALRHAAQAFYDAMNGIKFTAPDPEQVVAAGRTGLALRRLLRETQGNQGGAA